MTENIYQYRNHLNYSEFRDVFGLINHDFKKIIVDCGINFDKGIKNSIIRREDLDEKFYGKVRDYSSRKLIMASMDDFINKFDEVLEETNKKEKAIYETEYNHKIILGEINEKLRDRLNNIWFRQRSTKFVLHIGDTGSGKTYNAVEALKKSSQKCCYLSPLRLLSWEIYDKLNGDGIPCNLRTGEEEIIIPEANVTSCTVEMVDYSSRYDIAIIDECFMLSDNMRGKSWLKAILELNASEIHLIMNYEIKDVLMKILEATVGLDRVETKEYTRLVPLELKKIEYDIDSPLDNTIFVVFSRKDVLYWKRYFEDLGKNVSMLYGNLPPDIKKRQMELFLNGTNTICVSTDVIGMGLNLPCEHLCFLEMEKFDGTDMRYLNSTEIKQIGGRAGRYGLMDKGFVWTRKHHHNNKMHTGFSQRITTKNTFFGLDYSILELIPEKKLIAKLSYFENLDFIPEELKNYVSLQSLDHYRNLYITDLEKIPLEMAWTLLNCPTRPSSVSYWVNIVKVFLKTNFKKIIEPSIERFEFLDMYSLKEAEDKVCEYDLYSYIYNNRLIGSFCDENFYQAMVVEKDKLIERIDEIIITKKQTAKKRR